MFLRVVRSPGLVAIISPMSRAVTLQPAAFDSQAIQKTIQGAGAGDTVQLAAGTYELNELIQRKSRIRLIGSG